jgi:hypothetical protein
MAGIIATEDQHVLFLVAAHKHVLRHRIETLATGQAAQFGARLRVLGDKLLREGADFRHPQGREGVALGPAGC